MKILIWGYYSEGNFGDDAMGLVFAEEIRKLGYEPVLYGDGSHLREYIVAAITQSLPDAYPASTAILGGGGFLTSLGWRQRWFGSFSRMEKARLGELEKWLREKKVSLVPISIGGDRSKISPIKRHILSTYCVSGTVRLRSDLVSLEKNQIMNFKQHADILWLLPEILEIHHDPDRACSKVGFNIKTRHASSKLRFAAEDSVSPFNLKPVNVISHVDSKKYNYENRHDDWDTLAYTGNIFDFVREISNLSVMVSSKLHVGLVALSLRVPFISYRGPEKAKAALKELGLDDFIAGNPSELQKILRFLLENRKQVVERIRLISEQEIISAQGHLTHLEETLSAQQ
jgi:polysaccharide pyruvyl transferase WcaK-like protein